MNASGATPEIIARWGEPGPAHDPVMLSMFKPRSSDVLIATPAKSGTTWMQNILYQIKHKGDDSFKNIFDSVPWIEVGKSVEALGASFESRQAVIESYEKMEDPRIFKTHCVYETLPLTNETKVVLSFRDPRDVCVSMYHHYNDFSEEAKAKMGLNDLTWESHFESWMQRGVWFKAVESWWPHKNDENVLLLRYEEMLKDLPGNLDRIVSFLGWSLNETEKAKVLDLVSFEWMKTNVSRFNKLSADANPAFQRGFIRKGIAGDHKTLMTPEQEQKILKRLRDNLPTECVAFLELPTDS